MGAKRYNIDEFIGKRFGKWVVVRNDGVKASNGTICLLCRCDCGAEKNIRIGRLACGESLGCHRCMCPRVHGQRHTRLYIIWRNMKSRCYNSKNNRYHIYGGKGVKVCDEWRNSFIAFYNWAMSNGYREDLTIDRIDVDGNYEPSNCRWVTLVEQAQNKKGLRDSRGGYIGVSYYRGKKKQKSWFYRIEINGKNFYKGGYKTEKEALEAKNQYIKDNGLEQLGYRIQEYKGE